MATSTLDNTSLTWTSDGTEVLAALTASAGKLKLTGGVLQGASLAVACASNAAMRMMASSSTAGEFITVNATLDTIEHASSSIAALDEKFDYAGIAAWNVVGARVLIRTAIANNAAGGSEATNHPMNGIYKVIVAAVDGTTAWKAERAADFSVGGASGDVFVGNAYFVNAGTVHGRTTLVVSDNWTGDALYPDSVGHYNGAGGSDLNAEAARFISFAPAKASVIADGIVTTSSLAGGFELGNNQLQNNQITLTKFAAFNSAGVGHLNETADNADLLPIFDVDAGQSGEVKYITRANLVAGIGGSLPSGSDAQLIVYDGSAAAAVDMSGDATLNNAGVLTLAATQAGVTALGPADQRIDLTTTDRVNFQNSEGTVAYVNTATGHFNASAYDTGSDIRVKTNMQPIEDASAKLLSLPAFTFEYNGLSLAAAGTQSAGTSAQAVQEVLPSAVHVDDKGYLAVAYDQLHALHIAFAHEQIAKVGVLEARIEALEALLLLRADRQRADEPDVEAKQGGGGGSK